MVFISFSCLSALAGAARTTLCRGSGHRGPPWAAVCGGWVWSLATGVVLDVGVEMAAAGSPCAGLLGVFFLSCAAFSPFFPVSIEAIVSLFH